jgi:cell surface protein SprA
VPSYTLTNFQTNFEYDPALPEQTDRSGNFIPERLYSNINLVEQFNPLVRLDMELNNSLKVLAGTEKRTSHFFELRQQFDYRKQWRRICRRPWISGSRFEV